MVAVKPGAAAGTAATATLRPASGAFQLENRITTTAKKAEHSIIVDIREDRGVVRAKGKIWIKSGGYDAEVAVPDPTIFFGHVLHRALVRAGVSVGGEVVARPGWSSGNSLVVIITGTGSRTAESFDGDAAGAPVLYVEFVAP